MTIRGTKREDSNYFYYPQTGDGYARVDKQDLGGLPNGQGFLYRDSNGNLHMLEPNDRNLTSSSVNNFVAGQSTNVVLTGTNFTTGTEVDFGTGATVTNFTIQSTTQITATVNYATAGTKTIQASVKGDAQGSSLTFEAWTSRVAPGDTAAWENETGGVFGAGTVRKTAANGSVNCGGEFGLIPDGADFMLRWRVVQHTATTSMSGGALIDSPPISYPSPFPNLAPNMLRYSIFPFTSNFYRNDQDNTAGSSFSPWAANSVFDIRRIAGVSTGRHNNVLFTTHTTPHVGALRCWMLVRDTPNTAINHLDSIELWQR